ncbi:MAG TPA: alpha/beta fold hydrolase [Myxococcales bacterium]|nr:alpha/beta fold hydrolase [Myxococcales bacterium]
MTPRSLLQIEKSTTGRIVQLGMRALDALSPQAAQRLAFNWFGRPERRPEKPYILGHRFRLVADGPEIALWDWGEGRTVLLVHGWNGNAAQLSGFVPPLVRAGFYVAAPDLPAHGISAGKRSNVRSMADALLRVGKRVGPVHAVIAHSLGAAAAIIAQAEGLGAERMALIAPAVDLPRYATLFGRTLGLSPRSTAGLLAQVDRALGGRASFDILSLARRQTASMLALHDPEDAEVSFDESRALAVAWPGGMLETIEGAGHSRALRHPSVISRAVGFVADPPRLAALSA